MHVPRAIAAIAPTTRRLMGDRRAVASVELVLVTPLLALMSFAVVDIGNVLYTRALLGAALQAGNNYAVSRAADISTSTASSVSSSIGTIVSNTTTTNFANVVVTVNNGPRTTVTGGTASTTDSTPATTNALCYCPSTTTYAWGASVACGSTCTGGGVAGRFVQITASKTLTPMFSTYGLVANNVVTVRNMVQTE